MREELKLGGSVVLRVSAGRTIYPCVRARSAQTPTLWASSARTAKAPICVTNHCSRITNHDAFLIDTLPIRITSKPFACNKWSRSNRHSSETPNRPFLASVLSAQSRLGKVIVPGACFASASRKLPFSHTVSTNFGSAAPGCYPSKMPFRKVCL